MFTPFEEFEDIELSPQVPFISDQGVDFSRVNFGINMSLDLHTDHPQAFFVFVHAKQTLVFGQQGLQVMS